MSFAHAHPAHLDPRDDVCAAVHEKQASRDEDARRLAAGEVSREQLRRENNPFFGMRFSIAVERLTMPPDGSAEDEPGRYPCPGCDRYACACDVRALDMATRADVAIEDAQEDRDIDW